MRTVLTLIFLFPALLAAQTTSVKPGINASFEHPDVQEFVERFEREGREVYDHREKIVQSAAIAQGSTVADIGAGTGLFTRLLAKEVGDDGTVIAVDIAAEFVEHVVATAREHNLSNVRGHVCRQDTVNLPDNSIDVAFICDTYHHFEFPYKTMRSIWNALKPGGRVILVEFHRREGESSDWILGHVRAGQDVFVSEIHRSGFDVVEEQDFLETSYFMIFRRSEQRTPEGHTTHPLNAVSAGLEDGTAILLDVREQAEWNAGHLQQAQLSPLSEMQTHEQRKTIDSLGLPKDRIIYTHCRSGVRSMTAAQLLRDFGYDARALKAGFVDLAKAGFAVEQP